MKLVNMDLVSFINSLSSKEPVPGGGGASALAGALAISLGNMVGELTVGKKKYESVSEELSLVMAEAEEIKSKLLSLIDEDAEAFLPLAKAYSIPKDDPDRDSIMEEALLKAAEAPLEIMRCSARAVELIEVFGLKGSKLAISDAGCGAALAVGAAKSAALNVLINTKSMKNRETAKTINDEVNTILNEIQEKGESVYNKILNELGE